MKIVIMAGGKGTRAASINSEVPKPMIAINGKPILEYQVEVLAEQGYRDFIFTIGYLGHVIEAYFGNGSKISPVTGKPFGVNIDYVREEEPLGTAGAFYFLKDIIKEDFLLINGDVVFNIDVGRFYNFHKKCGGMVTLFTHPNDHPFDSAILMADSEHKVVSWINKEDERGWYSNRVNAGLHFFAPKILEQFTVLNKCDLDRDILKPLVNQGKVFVYDSPEYVKDMGTPERYMQACEDIRSGKVERKNLRYKQKAIFLDRDGTINKYVGFLRNIEEFELIDGVEEAVRIINQKGYLAIVITNQPVIARGEVTLHDLEDIHKKMETLLGDKGAYLDAIYYCPHHPHNGYAGEISELKIECNCRKPKPGMFMKAAEDFNIDLSNSWMVGDGEIDVLAGQNAGCKVAQIGNGENAEFSSLLEFVQKRLL